MKEYECVCVYSWFSSFVPNTKLPMIRDDDDDGFLRCVCVVCNAQNVRDSGNANVAYEWEMYTQTYTLSHTNTTLYMNVDEKHKKQPNEEKKQQIVCVHMKK